MNTMQEALESIAQAIEANGTDIASRDDYDLDTILNETHRFDPGNGWVQTVGEDQFWDSVQRHEK